MANSDGYTISVLSALRAHFKQPSGPSRAGADWIVVVAGGGQEKRLLVRTYEDEVGSIPTEDEAQLVIQHVAKLLESGWTPAQYQGSPGELVVGRAPADSASTAAVSAARAKEPWWRRLFGGAG